MIARDYMPEIHILMNNFSRLYDRNSNFEEFPYQVNLGGQVYPLLLIIAFIVHVAFLKNLLHKFNLSNN